MLLPIQLTYPKLLLSAVLLAMPALLIACAAPSASEQDKNWTEASGLIETSDRVLVAKFLESREESIQRTDSSTGAAVGDINVLFRQFELLDVLKGTPDTGDTLWVAFEPGRAGELVNGEGTVRQFDQTKVYVLFLKGRLRPLEYPTEFGPVLWTGNGEPSIAELVGDSLEFRAERPYLNTIKRDGASLPEPLSAAPFTLTLDELREATN